MCRLKLDETHGFILPFALVMLLIIAIYSMTQILSDQTLSKEISDVISADIRDNHLSSVMDEIAERVGSSDSPCGIFPGGSLNDGVWWLSHGCKITYQNQLYFYINEVLGDDPCAIINDNNTEFIARYIRLSVVSSQDMLGTYIPVKQGIYVLPVKQIEHCQYRAHMVNKGRQSTGWRQ